MRKTRDRCTRQSGLPAPHKRAVDAGWTSQQKPARPLTISNSSPHSRRSGRAVDARWTPRLVVVGPLDHERT
jgi:hypothetical protein